MPNNTPVGIVTSSKGLDTVEANTTWHHIRKGLIKELGGILTRLGFLKLQLWGAGKLAR